MKQLLFTLLICCGLLLVGTTYAQSDYYWSDNQKIALQEDLSTVAIYFDNYVPENALTSRLATQSIVEQVDIHIYKQRAILHFNQPLDIPASEVPALLDLESLNIRSVSYGFQLSDGFPLWLSHKIVLRLVRGADYSTLNSYIDEDKVRFVSEQYGNILIEADEIDQVLPLANALRESGLVLYAHPDFHAPVTYANDPLYTQQFQMNNTGQTIDGFAGTPDIDIDGPEAWGISTGSTSLVVAVIDDGVENHEDLNDPSGNSRLIGGFTPLTGGNGTPNSSGAHGQACAGIIAASHNSLGVRGAAPGVKLISVNIFAGNESATDIANGVNWAVNNGADVLSNSWGYTSCTANFSVLTNAINNASANGRGGQGCVVLFAAGNGFKSCVDYPANLNSVIAVGAVTNQGTRSSYSNYGSALDIVAPSNGAAGVRTIDRMGSAGYSSGNYTPSFGGTSAACPAAAGAAALVLSVDPGLTSGQVQSFLETTAKDLGPSGFDNEYAHGLVSAYDAMLAAQGGGGGGGGGGGTTYCTSQGNNASFEWISNVSFGNFSNSSGAAGYSDFTGQVVSAEAGSTYGVSVTPAFSGTTYQEYFKIWIDLNQDGDFTDSGEEVFSAGPTTTTATGNVTIPATASIGQTRMRVSMKWNATPTSCETFSYGEVEDYTIDIGTAAPTCDEPSSLSTSNITTTTATISWGGVTGAANYEVRFRVAGGSYQFFNASGTSLNITGMTPNTTYEWSVRTNCTNGLTSAWPANVQFTTDNIAVTYCNAGGTNSTYEWIDLVSLGSINNATGANGGYADFTNLSTDVIKGNSVTINFSKGSNFTDRNYWRVYIDWNQDGDFTDAGELMVSGSSTSNGTLGASFTVPTSAATGTTRMRVMMKYGSLPTSCETYTYGETEDYTLNVVNSGTNLAFQPGEAGLPLERGISSESMELTPNPATDWIQIQTQLRDPIERAFISDLTGRILGPVSLLDGRSTLDISHLPAGTYILTIQTANEVRSARFVRQ
jgi:subtilisin family serine protease